MPDPIAICIETLDPREAHPRFVRCVAVGGHEPGLRVTSEGALLWKSSGEAAFELWVSGDEQLILFRLEGAPRVVVTRAGRSLDVPARKPVVLRSGDEARVGEHAVRIHLHGRAPSVHAPAVLDVPSGRRATKLSVVVAATAAVVGCNTVEVRDNPPKIAESTTSVEPPPTAASATATETMPGPTTRPTGAAAADAVGVGRLRADGTLELDMFTPHARLTYAPQHPQYAEIKHHLELRAGPLGVGDDRPFGPFPEPSTPASSAILSGTLASEAARTLSALSAQDTRREQDLFCAPDGQAVRFSYVAPTAARPAGEGLRVPAAIARTLPEVASIVAAEGAVMANFDVEGRVMPDVVAVDLIPHLAPGERPHPGGGTSLGRELHLTFHPSTGALLKKLYAR